VERAQQRQAAWDLRVPKYRVFDWLATNIDCSINAKESNDGNNVWIAMANVYLNFGWLKEREEKCQGVKGTCLIHSTSTGLHARGSLNNSLIIAIEKILHFP
jgi:hypothetical protein